MKRVKISNEEYELVVKELSERIKDVVFVNAEKNVRKILTKERLEQLLDLDGGSEVELNYVITFVVNDILQIIGRKRRAEG